MVDKKELKERIKRKLLEHKKRKKTEGQVNIEGVTKPKKKKPKKVKEQESRQGKPGSVSVGAHGGRYVLEPSGHKRYVKEGQLAGTKRYKKSLKDMVGDVLTKSKIEEFVKSYKEKK